MPPRRATPRHAASQLAARLRSATPSPLFHAF